MKKLFLFVIAGVLMASCNPKNAEQAKTDDAKKAADTSGMTVSVNAEKSTVHWRGTKPSGEHDGTVGISKGMVSLDEGSVTGGKIVIDLTSIVNNDLEGEWNAKLVGHLMSEDFFYTDSFPEAVFEIVSIDEQAGGESEDMIATTHSVTGNLSMRGMTKSITFPASISVMDGVVKVQTNEFSIDRTLWGVNFKSKSVFAEFKDDFIGDMINLKFDVKFDKS